MYTPPTTEMMKSDSVEALVAFFLQDSKRRKRSRNWKEKPEISLTFCRQKSSPTAFKSNHNNPSIRQRRPCTANCDQIDHVQKKKTEK